PGVKPDRRSTARQYIDCIPHIGRGTPGNVGIDQLCHRGRTFGLTEQKTSSPSAPICSDSLIQPCLFQSLCGPSEPGMSATVLLSPGTSSKRSLVSSLKCGQKP